MAAINRAKVRQHFGSDEVMESLIARFPSTIRKTHAQLREALEMQNRHDAVCLLYQMRGAASWVCADALFESIVSLLRAVERDADNDVSVPLLQQLSEQVQRTCEAINAGPPGAAVSASTGLPLRPRWRL